VVIGYVAFEPLVHAGYFGDSIFISEHHDALKVMHEEIEYPFSMAIHALGTLPFWLAAAGVAASWYCYLKRPDIPDAIMNRFRAIYLLLDNKYFFDRFNDWFFAGGARCTSHFLWKIGDVKLIDGLMVNGSARLVGMFSGVLRRVQTGYIYHYAFSMIIGVFVLLTIHTWLQ
jgi:NADH-quinone oxidoreductase subunit L